MVLENLTIDLGDLQAGILVRKGTVKLDGCRIYTSNHSMIKMGIVVLPGAKLSAQNTTLMGLGTGIMIHSGGEANLSECNFVECTDGIQVCTLNDGKLKKQLKKEKKSKTKKNI